MEYNNDRRIWLLTDTHYNHKNIIEYCNRPKDYEIRFLSSCFRLLNSNDILVHLGDIGIGDDIKVHDKYIRPLSCRKWLIRGNHDKRSNTWYLNNGWDFVAKKVIVDLFGKVIMFSHMPIRTETLVSERIDLNIHGHFHNTNFRKHEPELAGRLTDKHMLLAHEYIGYEPILLRRFIEDKKYAKSKEEKI